MKSRRLHRGRKRLVLGSAMCVLACAMAAVLAFAPPWYGFTEYASGYHLWRLMVADRSVVVVWDNREPQASPPNVHVLLIDTYVKEPRWTSWWSSSPAPAALVRHVETMRYYTVIPGARRLRFNAWAVPLLTGASGGLMLAWLWRVRRGRQRPDRCVCGYDLRGLGAGAVCPECGERAKAK